MPYDILHQPVCHARLNFTILSVLKDATPHSIRALPVGHSTLPPIPAVSSNFPFPIFTTLNRTIRGSRPSVRLTACCVLALESNRIQKYWPWWYVAPCLRAGLGRRKVP